MSERELHPWDERPPAPTPPKADREAKPAFVYASTRDWPGYFAVIAGRPARETLLDAITRFGDQPGDPPLAVDFGCGEGRDTAELLQRGWRVHAIDGHPEALQRLVVRPDLGDPRRLTMQLSPFESVDVPRCRLLNASFSLPFCHPASFDTMWARLIDAIEPGGRFAGQLFGDRDTWAALPDRSHHTREQVDKLLDPLQVEKLDEEERDGTDARDNAKHWHVFHIVARKPTESS